MAISLTTKSLKRIIAEHDRYWDDLRPEMRQLRYAYETRFWAKSKIDALYQDVQHTQIEVASGYALIESTVASLFTKNPAVVVKGDIRGRGDARKVNSLANLFLDRARRQAEDASRLALIYPNSFLKLYPATHSDIYQRVKISTIMPWDVIVDCTADSWENQRYIAHRYWISLRDAITKFGNKKYTPVSRENYLDKDDVREYTSQVVESDADSYDQYIQVIEVYDMLDDRVLIYSEQYKEGTVWLYDGIELPAPTDDDPEATEKISKIPFRTSDDHPICPIVPLYFSRLPNDPMRGYSALRRSYDQIIEMNIIRTFQSAGVRKASRQWLVKQGTMNPDALSKLVMGIDGEYIEVDLPPGQELNSIIFPVPHTPIRPELEQYTQMVMGDLNKGSVMAPFTRGEATKATASEVTALAAYSSTEVGRLARERDAMIEKVAQLYISIIKMYLTEEGEKDLIIMDGKSTVLDPKDLDGDFAFYAQDGGSTPISDAQKKQELASSVPLLLSLGVSKTDILKELVRTMGLPESFIKEEQIQSPTQTPSPTVDTTLPVDNQLGLAPGSNPSPSQISNVLPG